jgi:hypothetical protein
MIHAFFLVGEIKKISVSEPKDPKKNASAVLLVQYGKQRETTGNTVEFVNAVMIRVPSYKYPQLKDKLKVGAQVQINGHLQGVFKTIVDDGYFSSELVADRIYVDEDEVSSIQVG